MHYLNEDLLSKSKKLKYCGCLREHDCFSTLDSSACEFSQAGYQKPYFERPFNGVQSIQDSLPCSLNWFILNVWGPLSLVSFTKLHTVEIFKLICRAFESGQEERPCFRLYKGLKLKTFKSHKLCLFSCLLTYFICTSTFTPLGTKHCLLSSLPPFSLETASLWGRLG